MGCGQRTSTSMPFWDSSSLSGVNFEIKLLVREQQVVQKILKLLNSWTFAFESSSVRFVSSVFGNEGYMFQK